MEYFSTGDELLCHAIILRAVEDWRDSRQFLKSHKRTPELIQRAFEGDKDALKVIHMIGKFESIKEECEDFFLGEWFGELTNLDGAELLEALKGE